MENSGLSAGFARKIPKFNLQINKEIYSNA